MATSVCGLKLLVHKGSGGIGGPHLRRRCIIGTIAPSVKMCVSVTGQPPALQKKVYTHSLLSLCSLKATCVCVLKAARVCVLKAARVRGLKLL